MKLYSIVSDCIAYAMHNNTELLTICTLYGYCGPMIKTTYTAKHHHHNVLQP